MPDGDHPSMRSRSFAHQLLGKLPPKGDPRTLRLAAYLDDRVVLPEIPKQFDYTPSVKEWPMYANDRLGDCTCAAAGHMIQAWTAAAGSPRTPTETEIVDAYWATGHGDNGRVEIDVLNWWRNHGIGTDRIAAYVAIDPKNVEHMRAAIYLFGGVYAGISLPLSAQRQTRWAVYGRGSSAVPGSWGGHAVPFHGYTSATFTCVTWGHPLKLTVGFNDRYTDEAYAIVSNDFLTGGKSPAGFDTAALQSDLQAIRAG